MYDPESLQIIVKILMDGNTSIDDYLNRIDHSITEYPGYEDEYKEILSEALAKCILIALHADKHN